MALGTALYQHIPTIAAAAPALSHSLQVTPTLTGSITTDALGSLLQTSTRVGDTEYLWASPAEGGRLLGTVRENERGGLTEQAADGSVVMSTADNGMGGQLIFGSDQQQVGTLQETLGGNAILFGQHGEIQGSVMPTLDGGAVYSPNPLLQRRLEAPGMPADFGCPDLLAATPDFGSFADLPDFPVIDVPQLDAGLDALGTFDGIGFDTDV